MFRRFLVVVCLLFVAVVALPAHASGSPNPIAPVQPDVCPMCWNSSNPTWCEISGGCTSEGGGGTVTPTPTPIPSTCSGNSCRQCPAYSLNICPQGNVGCGCSKDKDTGICVTVGTWQ
jgi:hypothetical protein